MSSAFVYKKVRQFELEDLLENLKKIIWSRHETERPSMTSLVSPKELFVETMFLLNSRSRYTRSQSADEWCSLEVRIKSGFSRSLPEFNRDLLNWFFPTSLAHADSSSEINLNRHLNSMNWNANEQNDFVNSLIARIKMDCSPFEHFAGHFFRASSVFVKRHSNAHHRFRLCDTSCVATKSFWKRKLIVIAHSPRCWRRRTIN